jgi:hypothetical protein
LHDAIRFNVLAAFDDNPGRLSTWKTSLEKVETTLEDSMHGALASDRIRRLASGERLPDTEFMATAPDTLTKSAWKRIWPAAKRQWR